MAVNTSTHKYGKQFCHSFAFDAPIVWNIIPGEIRVSLSVAYFRK